MDAQTDHTRALPLKLHRAVLGVSQYVIQAKSGVFQSRISLIENGLAQPKEKEVAAISKALGLQPNYIAWPTMRRPIDTQEKAA